MSWFSKIFKPHTIVGKLLRGKKITAKAWKNAVSDVVDTAKHVATGDIMGAAGTVLGGNASKYGINEDYSNLLGGSGSSNSKSQSKEVENRSGAPAGYVGTNSEYQKIGGSNSKKTMFILIGGALLLYMLTKKR